MSKLQTLKDTIDKELANAKDLYKVGTNINNPVMKAPYAGRINMLEFVVKPLVDTLQVSDITHNYKFINFYILGFKFKIKYTDARWKYFPAWLISPVFTSAE